MRERTGVKVDNNVLSCDTYVKVIIALPHLSDREQSILKSQLQYFKIFTRIFKKCL